MKKEVSQHSDIPLGFIDKMKEPSAPSQPVEKVQRKLGFFAFMWYNIGEGS